MKLGVSKSYWIKQLHEQKTEALFVYSQLVFGLHKIKLKIFAKCPKKMFQEIFRSNVNNFSLFYAFKNFLPPSELWSETFSCSVPAYLSWDVGESLLWGRHSSLGLPCAGSLWQLTGGLQCVLPYMCELNCTEFTECIVLHLFEVKSKYSSVRVEFSSPIHCSFYRWLFSFWSLASYLWTLRGFSTFVTLCLANDVESQSCPLKR